MHDRDADKQLVRTLFRDLEEAPHDAAAALRRHCAPDLLWRGMHPFHEQRGPDAVADMFWRPLHAAFAHLQRRQDIFLAGANDVAAQGGEWVCSMGHLMGLFDAPWLGIPPSGRMAFLRYAEFHRVDCGRITETAMFVDILGVMQQAGLQPLPSQTGAGLLTPGPRTHDGLLFGATDPVEGRTTLDLINMMARDLRDSSMESPQDELARTWHDRMIWYGPAGIGATYTRARYQEQHQGPFSRGLGDIVFNGHVARFAEGDYGAWFGWPNLTMTPTGGFLGLPASTARADMRVVDIYRRDGDRLAENWVLIDVLHFLAMQGLDVLGRLAEVTPRPRP